MIKTLDIKLTMVNIKNAMEDLKYTVKKIEKTEQTDKGMENRRESILKLED